MHRRAPKAPPECSTWYYVCSCIPGGGGEWERSWRCSPHARPVYWLQTPVAAEDPQLQGLLIRLKKDKTPKSRKADGPAFLRQLLPDTVKEKLFAMGLKKIASVGSHGCGEAGYRECFAPVGSLGRIDLLYSSPLCCNDVDNTSMPCMYTPATLGTTR